MPRNGLEFPGGYPFPGALRPFSFFYSLPEKIAYNKEIGWETGNEGSFVLSFLEKDDLRPSLARMRIGDREWSDAGC